MKLLSASLMALLFTTSAFAQLKKMKAFYNYDQKCGVVDISNEAFFEMYQFSNGNVEKSSGVNWPEENYSDRDLNRQDIVPVSHFFGGSPIANSYLVVIKNTKTDTYKFQRYDEALSSGLFPKNTTLCGNMEKLNASKTIELMKVYKVN